MDGIAGKRDRTGIRQLHQQWSVKAANARSGDHDAPAAGKLHILVTRSIA
jgi:hypothetical protein